ncbi:hypothetical protein [Nocardia beijingensis]|uniref:Uncharacterized protein n=1 Tax=Nocardia beijingensis TaxID=95162 RepID=A0ABW7W806_9NOCA
MVTLDFDACYVADRGALTGTLSVLPEYLRNGRQRIGCGRGLPGVAGAAGA